MIRVTNDVKAKERLVKFTEEEVIILERFIESGFVHGLIESRVRKLETNLKSILDQGL